MPDLDRLLIDGDLDALLRLVDDACDDADWDTLEQIATRSRLAVERGHQLWPAADHAEHRLALQAPGSFAAAAVVRDAPTFGVAPLAEVAASSHTWAELDPHLTSDAGALRAVVAHERVARGEDLRGLELEDDPLGLPLRLASWEPATDGPTIGPYGVDDPVPPTGLLAPVSPAPGVSTDSALPETGPADGPAEEPAACPEADTARTALRDLVSTWTEQSRGTASAIALRGTGPQAADHAGRSIDAGDLRLRTLTLDEAIGLLAWAGASGGAHGRRRGAARGRFEAWWCAAALVGMDGPDDDWPPDPDDLGDALAELRWWRWDGAKRPAGWFLGIAVDDPLDDLAWALAACDRPD